MLQPCLCAPLAVVTLFNQPVWILQNFGEHGRELVTVEVALELLRQLGDSSGAVQQSIARGHGPNRLLTLLQNTVFMVHLLIRSAAFPACCLLRCHLWHEGM